MLLALLIATITFGFPPKQVALALASASIEPYSIYERAREHWRLQVYPRFLSYNVRVTGFEGAAATTNTYQSFTATASGEIKVRATSAEEAAHPSTPRGVAVNAILRVSYDRHAVLGKPPTVDGGGDINISKTMNVTSRQQFDLLGVPLLSPTYSFGMASPQAKGTSGPTDEQNTGLKTIAAVVAVRQDYSIRYRGDEDVDGLPCYNLELTPVRSPSKYRLRELWIQQGTFVTRKAVVQGNFTEGPSARLAWSIHFTTDDGLTYISDETSLTPLDYLRHTYSKVMIAFNNIKPEHQMGVTWMLSTFESSGDVLQEPDQGAVSTAY